MEYKYSRKTQNPDRYRNSDDTYGQDSHYESWKNFYKAFLYSLSDDSFLGSIDLISFKDNYVQVKRGYWKLLFSIQSRDETKRVKSFLARNLKTYFIDRFSHCSATKIKNFLLKKISGSFLDFRNVLQYNERLFFSNPTLNKSFVGNIKAKKNYKYFEMKAKRYKNYVHKQKLTHEEYLSTIVDKPLEEVQAEYFVDDKSREAMSEFAHQIIYQDIDSEDPVADIVENDITKDIVDINNLEKIFEQQDESGNRFKIYKEVGRDPYIIHQGRKQTDFSLQPIKPSSHGNSNRQIRGGFYIGPQRVDHLGKEQLYMLADNSSSPFNVRENFSRSQIDFVALQNDDSPEAERAFLRAVGLL